MQYVQSLPCKNDFVPQLMLLLFNSIAPVAQWVTLWTLRRSPKGGGDLPPLQINPQGESTT